MGGGSLKIFARKGWVRQNEGGGCLEMGGCHIGVFLEIPHDAV